MAATWRVFTLDVWGNEEDGFDVNDRWPAGEIETSDEPTDAEVWCRLLEAGIARGLISDGEFDWCDEALLCVSEAATGRPVFQLERR